MTLIDKLSALTGPDREVDALIWLELHQPNWRKQKGWKMTNGWASEDTPSSMVSFYTPDGLGGSERAPQYSASIDAAMTLAGENIRHIEWCEGFVEAVCFAGDITVSGRAPTPAIALCIASLKAKDLT